MRRAPRRILWSSASSLAVALVAAGSPVAAQLPIRDNSFLVEEAYNQEWGVVQHITTFERLRDVSAWAATFTQEWPVPSERHQLSYTIPYAKLPTFPGSQTSVGDIALNYRYQVPSDIDRFAVAPRLSLLFPTGDHLTGHGTGALGWQVNLPVSVTLAPMLVTHLNAGTTWTPSAHLGGGFESTTLSVGLGGSLIYLLHPKLNIMLETAWASDETLGAIEGTERITSHVVSPGIRAAIDFPSGLQIVPGIAYPIGVGPSNGDDSVFLYVSFEHPFRRRTSGG
jgi:hypothetical protein